MIFKQLNPHSCKTYFIAEEGKKDIILVDPVIDHVKDYLELLDKNNYKLQFAIDTHTHADHISGAAVIKDHTDCEYIMHEKAPAKCPGFRVTEGETINFGNTKINVLETPGHTMDSISLITEDKILTGDALFLDDGGAGRDDLPGGDPALHWESLEKFKRLSDDLVVYPAHDYRNRTPSTLGHQKETNPHLVKRSKEEFITYLEDLKLGPADWMKDVLKANYACAHDPQAAWIPTDMPACEIKGTITTNVNEQQVEPIGAEELQAKMGSTDGPLLLDVREPFELSAQLGHISNSKNIPIGSLANSLNELDSYKDREIITICRSGARAHTAGQILKQAGFKDVKVLDGGMISWNEKGFKKEH